jgi:hypothetical protein
MGVQNRCKFEEISGSFIGLFGPHPGTDFPLQFSICNSVPVAHERVENLQPFYKKTGNYFTKKDGFALQFIQKALSFLWYSAANQFTF